MTLVLSLQDRNELAGGPRLGGNFAGPKADTSALWNGRPPVLSSGIGPLTLAVSARNDGQGAVAGSTVRVRAQCANAWGGLTTREFDIGAGLSAELRVGNYQHVDVRVVPTAPGSAVVGIPAGMTVRFSWSFDLLGRTPLYHFRRYTAAEAAVATVIQLPEGVEFLTAETACTLTWSLPQYGATFIQAVPAGTRVPAIWGAFSCNVANDFIFQLRGL
jgi:hypothetical protein